MLANPSTAVQPTFYIGIIEPIVYPLVFRLVFKFTSIQFNTGRTKHWHQLLSFTTEFLPAQRFSNEAVSSGHMFLHTAKLVDDESTGLTNGDAFISGNTHCDACGINYFVCPMVQHTCMKVGSRPLGCCASPCVDMG